MAFTLRLDTYMINAQAEQVRAIENGAMLRGTRVALDLPFQPARFYRHGWQSWSLTAWLDPQAPLPTPRPPLLHPMHADPRYVHSREPNGSGLGAVETPDGRVLLLGALGLEAHLGLSGQRPSMNSGHSLRGWYESGDGDWLLAFGAEEDVFAQYAARLGETLGRAKDARAPRVWCSWYSLYTAIDEVILLKVLSDLADLPFEVFQIDDGWQQGIGDWEANEKFPSGMAALANRIHASGRTPGLWLAPLLVLPSSTLYRQHPDWLLRDESGRPVSAAFNWNAPLYALDTSNPAVLDWLAALMKKVRAWGYDYVKLDFLYAGALPGKRQNGMPRETAYRQALQVMRAALGDAYLLTCGAPILPSLGLCDAMRVGPDVAEYWDNPRDSLLLQNPALPGAQNAIRTTVHRLWLRPLVHTDPDVVYFRSRRNALSPEQKQMLRDLALVCGFKATSDLPQWLSRAERAALSAFLQSEPEVKRTGRHSFTIDGRAVDFSPSMPLPEPLPPPLRAAGAVLGAIANAPLALRLNDWLTRRSLTRMRRELA